LISKYEKQIDELTSQCTMKSNECHMAWSSVDSSNLELGRLKIELHQKEVEMQNLGMDYFNVIHFSTLISCICSLLDFICWQSKP
jgi:hypothetical protein